jgi:hypothetical protein
MEHILTHRGDRYERKLISRWKPLDREHSSEKVRDDQGVSEGLAEVGRQVMDFLAARNALLLGSRRPRLQRKNPLKLKHCPGEGLNPEKQGQGHLHLEVEDVETGRAFERKKLRREADAAQ